MKLGRRAIFGLFLKGDTILQGRWLVGIGIVVAAVASLYFIIKLDLNHAVIALMALFALTNGSRAKSFKEQGMERESKWMRLMSIFFAVACILLFITNVIM